MRSGRQPDLQGRRHCRGWIEAQVSSREIQCLGGNFLALSDDSEPEPDLAVVTGTIPDYSDDHPTTALLVVEIADSSLLHDRKRKLPLHARFGVTETWLLNLVRRALEVDRDPVDGIYQTRLSLRAGDAVSPLACPDVSLPVSDLLP